MPSYGSEPESGSPGRDLTLTAFVLLFAFGTVYLPSTTQERISSALQVSALRPFIAMQGLLTDVGARRVRVEALQVTVDSLSAAMSTHQAVADENETLRDLLELQERAGATYRPATIHRPGTPGSESTFLVDVGTRDGIRAGAPVVSPTGLVGVIRETRTANSSGIDWTHPDFRPSAMLADGSAYGLIESRRGSFREEDRLVINGIPFHEPFDSGQAVLTSGLGGIFPRGIPIGTVLGVAEAEGTWRKAYYLEPIAEPAAATHVLVLVSDSGDDASQVWAQDTVGVIAPGGDNR
ncbi:MAG: rod shape-determining protein MreC [Longimicrobiales bacterium]|nr:rod shape-determining protein MreC [Longimicrobiales bacterium]